MATVKAPFDVQLNGKKYLVMPGTYRERPVPDTIKPFRTPEGSPEARDNNEPAWAWWEQSNWDGEGVDDWDRDGVYLEGWGVDLATAGQVAAAERFVQGLADTTNPDGYLLIPFSSTLSIAIGKTTGKAWTSPDLIAWTDRGFINGTSQSSTSWSFYKGALVVGMGNGDLRTTADGITWAAYAGPVKPSAVPAYVLGSYRSKLYIAWNSDLRTWNSSTLDVVVVLDGTPVASAVGAGSMFIIAQGTPAHLYMASGDQLVELMQWPNDFQPDDAIFTDTLYVSGGATASGAEAGQVWGYTQNGLELLYEFPEIHGAGVDYRIRSLAARGHELLFSYNKGAGIGIYNSTLDLYEFPTLGFNLGSRTPATFAGAGKVIGILPRQGKTAIGVAGEGLYYTTGFSDFQLVSSLFGALSKRVTKLWGLCKVTHTALQAGQSVQVEFSTDGGTSWTSLGTSNTLGAVEKYLPFPSELFASVIQYRITGTANNASLAVLDIAFSFIEASQNPKRYWTFVIGLGGSDEEPMLYRDWTPFERSSTTMKAELDGLWNKRFSFQDLFNKTYTVMMPGPYVDVDDIVRVVDSGDETSIESVLANYRVFLVEA